MNKSEYQRARDALDTAKCKACRGRGEVNDAEPGDISFATYGCDACGGTGLAPAPAPKASELLQYSAEPFDRACVMVREMEEELERLRMKNAALRTALVELMKYNPREEPRYDRLGLAYAVRTGDALLKVLDQCEAALKE